LIDVKTDAPLWADKFDASFVDIFSLQDSISTQVLEALTLELTGAERQLVAKHPTNNARAYKNYLEGRYHWSKWTEEGFHNSVDSYRKAIESEPNYATAYAGLADAYSALAFYSYVSPHEAEPYAESAARKALEIDNKLSEPHFSLATVLFFYRWDWAGAEREFLSALALSPNNALTQQGYGLFKIAMGRFQEANQRFRLALELDPVSPLINVTAGFPYFYSGQHDLACQQYLRALEVDPDFGLAHAALGESLAHRKMYDQALDEYIKAGASMGRTADLDSARACVLALSGRRQEALKILNDLKELSLESYVSANNIAAIYIGLNEIDHAFEWIGRAVAERAHRLVYLNVHPMYDAIRSDERFTNMLRRIGYGAAPSSTSAAKLLVSSAIQHLLD
jgi:serine/threonine-protein kinase